MLVFGLEFVQIVRCMHKKLDLQLSEDLRLLSNVYITSRKKVPFEVNSDSLSKTVEWVVLNTNPSIYYE